MSRILIFLPLLLVAAPGWGQESKPYVWGDHLTPDALAAAVKVATIDGGQPWAMFVNHSQTLPETNSVEAFLPPIVSTARFRRGTVQRFECRPAVKHGECSDWKATGEPKTYIQVADKASFARALSARTPAERPIIVEGNYSDNDLVSLVTFIRSKPQPPKSPDGWVRYGVSGQYPIMWITLEARGVISVGMSQDGWVGEKATVRHTPTGWTLLEVWSWIV